MRGFMNSVAYAVGVATLSFVAVTAIHSLVPG